MTSLVKQVTRLFNGLQQHCCCSCKCCDCSSCQGQAWLDVWRLLNGSSRGLTSLQEERATQRGGKDDLRSGRALRFPTPPALPPPPAPRHAPTFFAVIEDEESHEARAGGECDRVLDRHRRQHNIPSHARGHYRGQPSSLLSRPQHSFEFPPKHGMAGHPTLKKLAPAPARSSVALGPLLGRVDVKAKKIRVRDTGLQVFTSPHATHSLARESSNLSASPFAAVIAAATTPRVGSRARQIHGGGSFASASQRSMTLHSQHSDVSSSMVSSDAPKTGDATPGEKRTPDRLSPGSAVPAKVHTAARQPQPLKVESSREKPVGKAAFARPTNALRRSSELLKSLSSSRAAIAPATARKPEVGAKPAAPLAKKGAPEQALGSRRVSTSAKAPAAKQAPAKAPPSTQRQGGVSRPTTATTKAPLRAKEAARRPSSLRADARNPTSKAKNAAQDGKGSSARPPLSPMRKMKEDHADKGDVKVVDAGRPADSNGGEEDGLSPQLSASKVMRRQDSFDKKHPADSPSLRKHRAYEILPDIDSPEVDAEGGVLGKKGSAESQAIEGEEGSPRSAEAPPDPEEEPLEDRATYEDDELDYGADAPLMMLPSIVKRIDTLQRQETAEMSNAPLERRETDPIELELLSLEVQHEIEAAKKELRDAQEAEEALIVGGVSDIVSNVRLSKSQDIGPDPKELIFREDTESEGRSESG